ncbi:hypothetical protein ZYGM_000983 [Zygosaccharomyces mellis]|uniref:Calcineurin-like phosphoesterase domain-containing protein n=1 Tax=Zygosaccharomyces mellis TaxID=42258 RepID=A0A4C2EEC4_9SACH|nr:hypothetical protein ZYGM_000983 [Zygosaccharomyces mellis]
MRRTVSFISALLFVSVFAVYCAYVRNLLDSGPTVSLPKINLLDEILLPADKNQDIRLIFVGDVHGRYHEMVQLFEKTGLDDTTVVFLGDFLAKGPDSVQVANFILDNKDRAKCVLGNHDLAVMFAFLNPGVAKFPWYRNHRKVKPLQFTLSEENFIPGDFTKVNRMHLDISRQLGPEKIISLAQHCSAALHFDLGEEKVYGVHAGMLPGDFRNSIPSIEALTEMKYVDKTNWSEFSKEKKSKQFVSWFKLWKGSKLPDELSTTYVLYGHDASKGLNVRGHTMGLDTGCVKGGELTGMEFTRTAGKVTTKLHQVKCNGARRTALLEVEQKAKGEGKDVQEFEEWKDIVNGRKPSQSEPSETGPEFENSKEGPQHDKNSKELKELNSAGHSGGDQSESSDENREKHRELSHKVSDLDSDGKKHGLPKLNQRDQGHVSSADLGRSWGHRTSPHILKPKTSKGGFPGDQDILNSSLEVDTQP